MNFIDDPFLSTAPTAPAVTVADPQKKPGAASRRDHGHYPSAVTGILHGFDLNDQPLVSSRPNGLSIVVNARTTIPLLQSQIGTTVVMLFELGDPQRPIIIGLIQDSRPAVHSSNPVTTMYTVQADEDRLVVSAEREIVLRCGESSITLTRAGKVIISGKYVLSRSSGCNKIKGAIVDIN